MSVLPGFLEGNPVHTSLKDRYDSAMDLLVMAILGHGWALQVSIFPVLGKPTGDGWDERIFLIGSMQYKSHWPRMILSIALPATPPSYFHHSGTFQLNLPLTQLSFSSEEGKLLFIGLFLLRFCYGIIFIYLNDFILITSLVK